jgi:hypothetical protein
MHNRSNFLPLRFVRDTYVRAMLGLWLLPSLPLCLARLQIQKLIRVRSVEMISSVMTL